MNSVEALDILRLAIWAVMVASAPSIGAAMIVGIVIALLQALTQVQEVTLTFIPKIVVILLVVSATAPFMGGTVLRRACLWPDRARFLNGDHKKNYLDWYVNACAQP